MVRRIYYRDDEGDIVELTGNYLPREGWEVTENAEEGSTAMSTLPLDDPDMDFDLVGHRQFRILEDESEADDDVLYFGFVADQVYGRQGAGDLVEPVGRVVGLSVVDGNSLWGRRVLVGADCKRSAETDVERMTWLVGTGEMGYFDDTTLIASGSTVNMDAVDYRGQYVSQVADDCAQASGKNWWIGMRSTDGGTTHDIFVWYGLESLTTYESPLSLSNDPTDWDEAELEDGTSLVWPISFDTTLRRDPGRVYSGVYLPYERGAIYRKSSTTEATFALSGRDMIAPSLNVKSKAKAEARAARYLADLDEQDERITTTVVLPKGKATMLRAGMRVQFRATHLPGYTTPQWLRVLTCSIAPDAGGARYRLTLELSGPGTQGAFACSSVGDWEDLTGDYSWFFASGSPSHDPADPNDDLPGGGIQVGSSGYPSAGSPTYYGVDLDRGGSPSPASLAYLRFRFSQVAHTDSPSYGPSVWASTDGSSWTQLFSIAECWALRDGTNEAITLEIPADYRTYRYFRFRADDYFVSGFWPGSDWQVFETRECVS